jgi:nitronate monooxygenase
LITRLTTRLGITHPVILAPMESVSGGRLAAAVSQAGGLGLVAGGYGDYQWLARQFALAGGSRVGCGFITWALADDPAALYKALQHLRPVAVLLSFGDPRPYARAVRESGAILMTQTQTLSDVKRALEAGADVIVAQGTEAGGHGIDNRSTMTLVPAVTDLVTAQAPGTPVVATGGIADGRGIAAALALGADGVLMGTRFWATAEALAPRAAQARLIEATGEQTLRTAVVDVAEGRPWPSPFTSRVLRNQFTDQWHEAEEALSADPGAVREQYSCAAATGNYDIAAVSSSQSADLIGSVSPAGELVSSLMAEAEDTISRLWGQLRVEHPGGTPSDQTG